MEKRIVECVPNFSEGRDKAVIDAITAAIVQSGGVKLLDVDPGEATNRTVVTFVGSPEAVVEAAFAGVRRAAELIESIFNVPATFFIALTWALPPTRLTEIPTSMAGRLPWLKRFVSRNICPSVIEITFVGI